MRILTIGFGVCAFFFSLVVSAAPTEGIPSSQVYLVRAFSYDAANNVFKEVGRGSAVYLEGSQVVTNAHVVLDDNNKPYDGYLLCETKTMKSAPKCSYAAKVVRADPSQDVALLQAFSSSNQLPVSLGKGRMNWSKKGANAGDIVRVYGYPANG